MKKKILMLCLTTLIMFTLFGCGSSNKIVGTWKSELGGATYRFDKDGTGLQYSDFVEGNSFKYTIKDDVLTITENQGGMEIVTQYYFKVEDGQLKMAVKLDSNERIYMVYSKTDDNSKITSDEKKLTEENNIKTNDSDKELLVGQWDGSGYSYVFNEDYTGLTYGIGGVITSSFTYKIENGHIFFTENQGSIESVTDYIYQLEGDTLKIAVNTGGSSQFFFVMTKSSNSNDETSDSNGDTASYDLNVWYSALDGTVAAGGSGAWSLSWEQSEQNPKMIVKLCSEDTEIKDTPNGKTIGVAHVESEFGVFDTKKSSGTSWYKVNNNYDWWVDANNFVEIDDFSEQ